VAYRNRSRSEGSFQLNLTPLLDVVLQLITFFMMLIHFGTKIEGAAASIKLPTAPAALPAGDLGLDRLVVSVDAKGNLIAEGDRLDEGAAETWWAEQARKRRAGLGLMGRNRSGDELPTQVVVRADKDAKFGVVRGLLATAQRLGFAKFTLVVVRGPQP
jgi:biopolymer transport protein ExbD